VANGSTKREIARALAIAVQIVRQHVSNILSKLWAGNRTQAVAQVHAPSLLVGEREGPGWVKNRSLEIPQQSARELWRCIQRGEVA